VLSLADPTVQVYSRHPGEYGKENVLICYVSGFHPPDISIKLLKNGVEIQGSKQTDLAFEEGWKFHLTRYVEFNPKSGEHYTCSVSHMGADAKLFSWGENRSEVLTAHCFVLDFLIMFL